MRRNFFIYLGALAASAFLGWRRPGFVSTMIFYMMLCLPVAELVLMGITYGQFKISHAIDKGMVVKGETVQYELSLMNPTLFLFAPLRVFYSGSDVLFEASDLNRHNTVLLYPYNREKFKKDIGCAYRGSYYVGVDRLEIQGFFGFFHWGYRGMESLKILVYPNIHEMKARSFPHALSETSESIVSFDQFDQSIFSELRDYQPGDGMNRIHWKLSARKEALVTKVFEGNVNNRTKIFLNTAATELTYEQRIVVEDYLVEGAVALCNYLLKNSTPTSLHWQDKKTVEVRGSGEKDFQDFYKALALVQFSEGAEGFVKLLEEKTASPYDQCVVFIFTTHVTAAMGESLLRKKRQGYAVNLVTLPMSHYAIGGQAVSFDNAPVYRMMDNGIPVYHMTFEDGICRMDVV